MNAYRTKPERVTLCFLANSLFTSTLPSEFENLRARSTQKDLFEKRIWAAKFVTFGLNF